MKHLGATNIHARPTQKVGFVLKPHGYAGQLKIELEYEDYTPSDFLLLLINDKFVPFKIESFNPDANIIKFSGFDSVDSVSHLISLPIVELVDEVESDTPAIVGYTLIDEISQLHYVITAILEMPGHDLIEFRAGYKDALLPFHEDIVTRIDHDNQTVYAIFPDGILDL